MCESLSPADVTALAGDCLRRAGVPEAAAAAVAGEVAAAEAAGLSDQGLRGLLRDLRLIRYGRISPDALTRRRQPKPGLLRLDGGHGLAAAVLAEAAPGVAALARNIGIALVQVQRISAPGAMLRAVEALAEAGVIGIGAEAPCADACGRGAAAAMPAPRLAHPDRPIAVALAGWPGGVPVTTLAALQPMPDADGLSAVAETQPDDPAQPADSPFGAPVRHGAWMMAVDPAAAADLSWIPGLRPDAAPVTRADRISLTSDLLAEIVTA
jgi:(2R)-3-sulfolactate dehydrogenase (NADP+)